MALAKVVRNFVYKCPDCGETVDLTADIFSLSEGYSGYCECGGSSLRAIKQGGKYRVSVPCGFCGDTHSRSFGMMELVRGNPLFIFCPMNDRYCACIGAQERIVREVDELELSYSEGEKIRRAPDEYWNSPSARHDILKKMVNMITNGLMACQCGGKNMRLELIVGETFLRCGDCGSSVAVPTLDGINVEDYPEIQEVLYKPENQGRADITPITGPKQDQ